MRRRAIRRRSNTSKTKRSSRPARKSPEERLEYTKDNINSSALTSAIAAATGVILAFVALFSHTFLTF